MARAYIACEIYYLPKECRANYGEMSMETTDTGLPFKNSCDTNCSEGMLFSLETSDKLGTTTINNYDDANKTNPLSKSTCDNHKQKENTNVEVKKDNYMSEESMLKCLNQHRKEDEIKQLFCEERQLAENSINNYDDTIAICDKVNSAEKNKDGNTNSLSYVTIDSNEKDKCVTNIRDKYENKATDMSVLDSINVCTVDESDCTQITESNKCEHESLKTSEVYKEHDLNNPVDMTFSNYRTSSSNIIHYSELSSENENENNTKELCRNTSVHDQNEEVDEKNLSILHSQSSCSSLGMSTDGMSSMELIFLEEWEQHESSEEELSEFRKKFDVSSYCHWKEEDNYCTPKCTDKGITDICVNNDANDSHCDTWQLLAPLERDEFHNNELDNKTNTGNLCEKATQNTDGSTFHCTKERENILDSKTQNEFTKLIDNIDSINSNNEYNENSNTSFSNEEKKSTYDNLTRKYNDMFFSAVSHDKQENSIGHLSNAYRLQPRLNTFKTSFNSFDYRTNLPSVFTTASNEFPSRCNSKIKEIKNALKEFPYIHPFFNIDWQETQREIENRQHHAEYCTEMTKSASLSAHDAMIACKMLLNEAHRVYHKRFQQFNVRRNNGSICLKIKQTECERSRNSLTHLTNVEEDNMYTFQSAIQEYCAQELIAANTEQIEVERDILNVDSNNNNSKNNKEFAATEKKDADVEFYQTQNTINEVESNEPAAFEENDICTTENGIKNAPELALRTEIECITEELQCTDEAKECIVSNASNSNNHSNIMDEVDNVDDKTNSNSRSGNSIIHLQKRMSTEYGKVQEVEWEKKKLHNTQWRDIERFVENDLFVEGYPFVQRRISCMCVFNPLSDDRFYCDNEVAREQRVNRQRAILLQLRRQAADGKSPYFLEHGGEQENELRCQEELESENLEEKLIEHELF